MTKAEMLELACERAGMPTYTWQEWWRGENVVGVRIDGKIYSDKRQHGVRTKFWNVLERVPENANVGKVRMHLADLFEVPITMVQEWGMSLVVHPVPPDYPGEFTIEEVREAQRQVAEERVAYEKRFGHPAPY